jgi:hypothetical protein
MDLVLSEQQQRFFDVFGFLKLPGLIADIADEVIEDFETIWAEHGGGHHGNEHDGRARACILPFIDQNERLSGLLDDPRIHGLATSLIGDDFNYLGGDGNLYVGDTDWHPDGRHRELRFIKIAFYLDPVDATSGALRVIPGSHHIGDAYGDSVVEAVLGGIAPEADAQVAEDDYDAQRAAFFEKMRTATQRAFGVTGDQLPAASLDSNPGDVVVFNHNLCHSSWGGSGRRRMFVINACEHVPDHLVDSELRSYIAGCARFWIDSLIGPAMLATAGPQRMRHLEQVLANQEMLPELHRSYRESMLEPSRG